MPKITLPVFTEKFEVWNLFKSQFTNLIIDNKELTENDKFHYLHSALKGEAKILEMCDDDFTSLFKALEQRFENPKLKVDSHIRKIFNVLWIKNESSADLRNLLDKTKKNLRALQILDFKKDKLSDGLLLNDMLGKIDREKRKQYE